MLRYVVLTPGGATLNSHWSVEDSCCVQYLYCETCHRGGDQCHLVGAQVRAVTAKTNAYTKIGQVCATTDSSGLPLVRDKSGTFKVRDKSGNFVLGQGNLRF